MQPFVRFPKTSRRLTAAAVAACFAIGPALACAPTGGAAVVNGTACFNQAGNVLTITNSNGAIINWQAFNVARNATTHFQQPTASSSVLNRVLLNEPSVILGTLSSNGRVWLVNPAGIMVGPGGRVDTAAFVASTLNITNADFLANRMKFGTDGLGGSAGNVTNQGTITTPLGGAVYLIGKNVTNDNGGIITTPKGETLLASGSTVELIDSATPGVKVELTGAAGNATNLGEIVADAGRIGIAGVIVRNSGVLNASSVVEDGGRVFLRASKDTYVDGAGRIVTTGRTGGRIDVLGDRVAVMGNAELDASGREGGGYVRVGGDFQGKNPEVPNASETYFGPNARVRVDATEVGDGGTAILWADGATRAYGRISARGGADGGDGGFVEVSGKRHLTFRADVDRRAPKGKAGVLLLDPADITIFNADQEEMGDRIGDGEFSEGVFSGANDDGGSYLSWETIVGQLASGPVQITTTGDYGSGDITFGYGYTYTSASNLSFLAYRDINTDGKTVTNNGSGGFTLIAGWNESVSAPDVRLGPGSITGGGSFYTRGGNFVAKAPGSISLNTISTWGGNSTTPGATGPQGGNVTLVAGDNINVWSINANGGRGGPSNGTTAGGAGGSGGVVSLTAGAGLSAVIISATGGPGGEFGGAGGNGGEVSVVSASTPYLGSGIDVRGGDGGEGKALAGLPGLPGGRGGDGGRISVVVNGGSDQPLLLGGASIDASGGWGGQGADSYGGFAATAGGRGGDGGRVFLTSVYGGMLLDGGEGAGGPPWGNYPYASVLATGGRGGHGGSAGSGAAADGGRGGDGGRIFLSANGAMTLGSQYGETTYGGSVVSWYGGGAVVDASGGSGGWGGNASASYGGGSGGDGGDAGAVRLQAAFIDLGAGDSFARVRASGGDGGEGGQGYGLAYGGTAVFTVAAADGTILCTGTGTQACAGQTVYGGTAFGGDRYVNGIPLPSNATGSGTQAAGNGGNGGNADNVLFPESDDPDYAQPDTAIDKLRFIATGNIDFRGGSQVESIGGTGGAGPLGAAPGMGFFGYTERTSATTNTDRNGTISWTGVNASHYGDRYWWFAYANRGSDGRSGSIRISSDSGSVTVANIGYNWSSPLTGDPGDWNRLSTDFTTGSFRTGTLTLNVEHAAVFTGGSKYVDVVQGRVGGDFSFDGGEGWSYLNTLGGWGDGQSLVVGGDLDVQSDWDININDVSVGKNATISSDWSISKTSLGTLVTGTAASSYGGGITLEAGSFVDITGELRTHYGGDVSIVAGNGISVGAPITTYGETPAYGGGVGGILIAAGSDLHVAAPVESMRGAVKLYAGAQADGDGGWIGSGTGGNLTLAGSGAVRAESFVSLEAWSGSNAEPTGDLTAEAGSEIRSSSADVGLRAGRDMRLDGSVRTDAGAAGISASAGRDLSQQYGGEILSSRGVELEAGRDIRLDGSVRAVGGVEEYIGVYAGRDLTVNGLVENTTSWGEIDLEAGRYGSEGEITTGGNLTLGPGSALRATSQIYLAAYEGSERAGDLTKTGAGSEIRSYGGRIFLSGDGNVALAGAVVTDGGDGGEGGIYASAGRDLTQSGAGSELRSYGGSIEIHASGNILLEGSVLAEGNGGGAVTALISVPRGGPGVTATAGRNLRAKGSVTATNGAVVLRAGEVYDGYFQEWTPSGYGGDLILDSGSAVRAGSWVELVARGGIEYGGDIKQLGSTSEIRSYGGPVHLSADRDVRLEGSVVADGGEGSGVFAGRDLMVLGRVETTAEYSNLELRAGTVFDSENWEWVASETGGNLSLESGSVVKATRGIDLTAWGGSGRAGDLTQSGAGSQIRSEGGQVHLSADGNVSLSGSVQVDGGVGSVQVLAGRDLTVAGRIVTTADYGRIDLRAGAVFDSDNTEWVASPTGGNLRLESGSVVRAPSDIWLQAWGGSTNGRITQLGTTSEIRSYGGSIGIVGAGEISLAGTVSADGIVPVPAGPAEVGLMGIARAPNVTVAAGRDLTVSGTIHAENGWVDLTAGTTYQDDGMGSWNLTSTGGNLLLTGTSRISAGGYIFASAEANGGLAAGKGRLTQEAGGTIVKNYREEGDNTVSLYAWDDLTVNSVSAEGGTVELFAGRTWFVPEGASQAPINTAAKDIRLGTVSAAGGDVTAKATGAIYDNNATGVVNVTSKTATFESYGGHINVANSAAAGRDVFDLAISADVSVTESVSATVLAAAGNSGGIRIRALNGMPTNPVTLIDRASKAARINFHSTTDITSGALLAVETAGDVSLSTDGDFLHADRLNLTGSPNALMFASARDLRFTSDFSRPDTDLQLVATGTLDATGADVVGRNVTISANTVKIDSGSYALGGSISAREDMSLIAGSIRLDGYGALEARDDFGGLVFGNVVLNNHSTITSGYGKLNLSVGGSLGVGNGSSLYAGRWAPTHMTLTINNDIAMYNDARLIAGDDVKITMRGKDSTIYINELPNLLPSQIISDAYTQVPATTYVTFTTRSSGGIVIDGLPTTDTTGGSGFFVMNGSKAASIGKGLEITWASPPASSGLDLLTAVLDRVVEAEALDSTPTGGQTTLPKKKRSNDKDDDGDPQKPKSSGDQKGVGQCSGSSS